MYVTTVFFLAMTLLESMSKKHYILVIQLENVIFIFGIQFDRDIKDIGFFFFFSLQKMGKKKFGKHTYFIYLFIFVGFFCLFFFLGRMNIVLLGHFVLLKYS